MINFITDIRVWQTLVFLSAAVTMLIEIYFILRNLRKKSNKDKVSPTSSLKVNIRNMEETYKQNQTPMLISKAVKETNQMLESLSNDINELSLLQVSIETVSEDEYDRNVLAAINEIRKQMYKLQKIYENIIIQTKNIK